MLQIVSIRDSIDGEFKTVRLPELTQAQEILDLYNAFSRFKKTGIIAEQVDESEILLLKDLNDYSEDFVYDAQQYRKHFSGKTWEQFNLSDAAFMIGYLHVPSNTDRYSAMPFLAELIIRAEKWVTPFNDFLYKLRRDVSEPNDQFIKHTYDSFSKNAMLAYLGVLKVKTEEREAYEMARIIERIVRDMKSLGGP